MKNIISTRKRLNQQIIRINRPSYAGRLKRNFLIKVIIFDERSLFPNGADQLYIYRVFQEDRISNDPLSNNIAFVYIRIHNT